MTSYGCRDTKWRCMQRAAIFSMLVLSISSSRADQKASPADAHDRQQRRDSSRLSAVVESNRPFFIQDPTDGLCLGGSIFKRCAVDTLWKLQGDALSWVVRRMAVRDDGERSFPSASSKITYTPFTSTYWELNAWRLEVCLLISHQVTINKDAKHTVHIRMAYTA